GADTYTMTLPDRVVVKIRTGEFIAPDGSIGFHPDIVVPASTDRSDKNPALRAALKAVHQPIPAKKETPAAPASLSPRPENPYTNMRFPTSEYRLLALFRFWNVIHYFFPYKELMDVPWNRTLTDFIPRFEADRDALSYATTAAE